MQFITCECGKICSSNVYKKHLLTNMHIKKMNRGPYGRPIKYRSTTDLFRD